MQSIIIKKPHLSEKSTGLRSLNQYIFEVPAKFNKEEIKGAIEEYYHVKIIKIRTINPPSKPIIWRNKVSQRRRNKKAIVTLAEGQKIELGA